MPKSDRVAGDLCRNGFRNYVRGMVHHWRPSDTLEHHRAGEWSMYDRGYLVGTIEYGSARGQPVLRGRAPDGSVLGYARTLEEASDALWAWYRRVGRISTHMDRTAEPHP